MQALGEEVSLEELVGLCAIDGNLYARSFFPKTARQESPQFHKEMDEVLENPENRFVGFEVFRGGAKTTKLRLFASKRIAYGISHTIIIIGKSQEHAVKSVHWLKVQIEHNRFWTQTFGLRKGEKWTDSEIEIIHGTDEYPIRIIGLGITGSIRGILVDDYRPDLIILDDPCDEVNTATLEGREKMSDLVFGALSKSLAPVSEAPDATMALAQTVLIRGDLIDCVMEDTQWASVRFSCFKDNGESAWAERWTTKELLDDKQAHINRNQLSLWLREMECQLVTQENSAFLLSWLDYWDVLPPGGITYIGIDPTPPPKDGNTLKQVNQKLDDAVIMVIKLFAGKVFVADYYACKSPDPMEFINKIFEMVYKWNPIMVGIETVMNQRTLKSFLEREMHVRRKFFHVTPVEDKRKKETRIVQTISRYASNRQLVVNKEHVELIEQYSVFQAGATRQHDDYLDALTIAMDLINPALEGVVLEGDYTDITDESNIPELDDWRGAP